MALLTTNKFPQKALFTFSDRINNLAIDIIEDLVEARYSKSKVASLTRANLKIEKLRILSRRPLKGLLFCDFCTGHKFFAEFVAGGAGSIITSLSYKGNITE